MIHAPWILSCRFFTKNITSIHTEKPIKKALAKDWPKTRFNLIAYLVYQKYLVKSSLFWKFIQTIPKQEEKM